MIVSEVFNPTFLVAKFIPDLRRQEPRNVGVILFHKDGVFTRFYGEGIPTSENPSGIDGRAIKDVIRDVSTYQQWIHYWRYSIEPFVTNISLEKLKILESELVSTSKFNYIVQRGGEVFNTDLESKDPSLLLTWLYNQIVEEEENPPVENIDLRKKTEDALTRFGLWSHPLMQFRPDLKVRNDRSSKEEKVEPDFILVTPKRYNILEMISLHATSKRLSRRAVDAVQYMYDRLEKHAKNVNHKEAHFYSLFDGREDRYSYDVADLLEPLTSWGKTVDVATPGATERGLADLREDDSLIFR